jgi:hypothetical protein
LPRKPDKFKSSFAVYNIWAQLSEKENNAKTGDHLTQFLFILKHSQNPQHNNNTKKLRNQREFPA